jgi:hypothetical protein
MLGFAPHIVNAVDHYIVKLDVTLIEQPHVCAKSGCSYISDLYVANIGRQSFYRKSSLKASVQARQRNRVVLGESGDIFDQYIVTALAEIDAVGVLYKHLVVLAPYQAVIFVAVFVDADVARAKVDVSDITV